jgi:hypothetical protein
VNRKIIYLLAGAVVIVAFYGAFIIYKNNPDRLFAALKQQLEEQRFEEVYDESGDLMHLNVTKEQFVVRMTDVVSKLKEIDENLNFQRDKATEAIVNGTGSQDSPLIMVIQTLEKDNKSVAVMAIWRKQAQLTEFFDLAVLPKNSASKEFAVTGISYKE